MPSTPTLSVNTVEVKACFPKWAKSVISNALIDQRLAIELTRTGARSWYPGRLHSGEANKKAWVSPTKARLNFQRLPVSVFAAG